MICLINLGKYPSISGYVNEVARYLKVKSRVLAEEEGDERYYCEYFKLHTLMFYAQGHMLGTYGKPLFQGAIHASVLGPRILDISHLSNDETYFTELPNDDIFLKVSNYIFNDNELEVLNDILRRYGKFDRYELKSISEKEDIWIEKRKEDSSCSDGLEIELEDIRKYFKLKLLREKFSNVYNDGTAKKIERDNKKLLTY